jgi:hypothetical protein
LHGAAATHLSRALENLGIDDRGSTTAVIGEATGSGRDVPVGNTCS